MLWILAGVSFALLCYEIPTLVTAILSPLLRNPHALQTDFHYYYDAAVRFGGDRSQLYLASDDVLAGFAYPPPAILPFMALSTLSLGAALTLFTMASYAMLLVAVRQWLAALSRQGPAIDRRTQAAIMLIVFALGPTYMNAVFGQVNTFVLASAVAFAVMADAAPMLAGTALACGAALKLYPLMMAWSGLWHRRAWNAMPWMVAAGVTILIASLAIVPIDAYRTFLFTVLPARGGTTAIHISNQSMVAFLERFRYDPQLFLNWTGQQAIAITPVVSAIAFGTVPITLAVIWRMTRASRGVLDGAAVLMALVAMVAPLGWGHTYVMALPLVITQLLALTRSSPMVSAVIGLAVVSFMIPAGRQLPVHDAPAFLQNLLYSRYLLATVALMATSAMTTSRMATSRGVSSA